MVNVPSVMVSDWKERTLDTEPSFYQNDIVGQVRTYHTKSAYDITVIDIEIALYILYGAVLNREHTVCKRILNFQAIYVVQRPSDDGHVSVRKRCGCDGIPDFTRSARLLHVSGESLNPVNVPVSNRYKTVRDYIAA